MIGCSASENWRSARPWRMVSAISARSSMTCAEPRVERLHPAAAAFLGVVHRGVGLGDARQRVAVAVDERDAGAGRQREQLTAGAR